MAAKKKAPDAGTFEQALGKLEGLVEAMESDQLPLEELVDHYEKGAKLLQHCEQVLAGARKRIELIEIQNSTQKGLAPEPDGVEDQTSDSSGGDPDDDDIRLF